MKPEAPTKSEIQHWAQHKCGQHIMEQLLKRFPLHPRSTRKNSLADYENDAGKAEVVEWILAQLGYR